MGEEINPLIFSYFEVRFLFLDFIVLLMNCERAVDDSRGGLYSKNVGGELIW